MNRIEIAMPDFEITLPPSTKHQTPANKLTTRGPLVIVGANGSGKSRLAAWLERKEIARSHRVSAQRSLSFPEDFRGTTIEKAEGQFLYGHESFSASQAQNKFGNRWGGHPDRLLNDFQALVTLLFSEGAQMREEYVQRMAQKSTYEQPPLRKLDIIKRIWEHVLPNRELLFGGHKIEARKRGASTAFSPHEMSDGERVIFYLIGQCLCAPKNGVLILDEPELHLHRALQTRLWDAVETERKDCLLVYITHDLDFAASRKGGTHVWLSEYSAGDKWEWDVVPSDSALPEALLLEILGSRKPVLLVEGKSGGDDERLYRLLYPNYHVIAFGGCEQVIHATASSRKLRDQGQLQVETRGLIDRDGRNEGDVAALSKIGVQMLEWAEIENLIMSEEVLRHVALAIHRDAAADLTMIQARVFETFGRDAGRIASELAGREIDRVLRSWGWKHPDGTALLSSYTAHLGNIDAAATLAAWQNEVQKVIDTCNYVRALQIYPNKGLLSLAGQVLGLAKFGDYVIRRAASAEGAELVILLQKSVPSI